MKTKEGSRVTITAWFGNGDEIDASLELSRSQWGGIVTGEEYSDSTDFSLEGDEQTAFWHFNRPGGSELEIDGDDGAEYFHGNLNDLELEVDGKWQPWRGVPR